MTQDLTTEIRRRLAEHEQYLALLHRDRDVDGYLAASRAFDQEIAQHVPKLLEEADRLRGSAECLEIARADVAEQLDEMTTARDEACGELEDTGGEFAIARAAELRKVGPKSNASHRQLTAPAELSDEDLDKIRATAEGATPGPWRPSPSRTGVVAAVDNGWVCQVNRITTVLDVEFIAMARSAVPKLISEVKRLRPLAADRWALTAFRDASDEADGLIKERGRLRAELDEQHNAITCLSNALAEALDLFDTAWCPEHGHAPKPEQLARAAELRKLTRR